MIGLDGRMTGDVPASYAGLTRGRGRGAVVAWLQASTTSSRSARATGTRSAHCERSGTRIQPLISLQWWCAMDEIRAGDRRRSSPGAWRSTRRVQHRVALDWLERSARWNMSRQLWWGHQLPIWYCPDGHVDVRRDEPDACAECGSRELDARRRTCSTRGSRRRSGRSRRSAGPTRRPSCARSIRATSTRRRARSSSSGRTG